MSHKNDRQDLTHNFSFHICSHSKAEKSNSLNYFFLSLTAFPRVKSFLSLSLSLSLSGKILFAWLDFDHN